MEIHVGMTLTGKAEELREKTVPVPLSPPQIPHGLTPSRTRASEVATNRLSHGTTLIMVCEPFVFIQEDPDSNLG
jgi:hypothetical protein